MVAIPPPSKREQLNKLLERGSVFVHLDPRRESVVVPAWLTKKPQLVLQLGLNFPIPIRDLEIDDAGVRCTLSFNRAPFYCVLPWSAVYALVAEDGQVTVWPSELPSELVPQAEPALRRDGPRERRTRPDKRPRISVVPPPGDATVVADASAADSTSVVATDVDASRTTPPAAEAHEPTGRADRHDTHGADEPTEDPSSPPRNRRPLRERPPYLRLVK